MQAVEGLRRGRTKARDGEPVRPVSDEDIEATLAKLPAVVRDMVRVPRLTGCRSTELCIIRPGDIDRTETGWRYRPAVHKTEHHDRDRVIFLGPLA